MDPREQEARAAARAWAARARTYAKTNIKTMVIFGAVGFVVAWVLNVWFMAEQYDGFRTPSGAPATGTGNFFRGTLFYMLASALITSVISYRLLVGSERFWREVYGVPLNIKRAFTTDGDQTLVHVLVGFSAAMLIVLIVGPSVAAALAVGSLLVFTPVLRPVVTGVLLTTYRWLVGRVAPKRTQMPPTVGMLVGVSGSTAAFALGGILPNTSALMVGLVAVVVAIVVSQRSKPSASSLLLVLGAGVLAYWFSDFAIALADDGGKAECGQPNWDEWRQTCTGAGRVMERANIGATGAAIGAMIGAALGGSADPGTGDGDPDNGGRYRPDDDGSVGPTEPRITVGPDDEVIDPLVPGSGYTDPDDEPEFELIPVPVGGGGRRRPDLEKIDLKAMDWDNTPDEIRHRIRKELLHAWREQNPNADYVRQQQAAARVDFMMWDGGPAADWMEDAWEFASDTLAFTWQDFKDGRAILSIEGAVEGMWDGIKTGAIGVIDLVRSAPELIGVSVEFWVSQNPLDSMRQIMDEIPEMTQGMAEQFLGTMNELKLAAENGDNEKVGRMIGIIAGQLEFEVLMGAGTMKATAMGREAAHGTRIGNAIDKAENFITKPRFRRKIKTERVIPDGGPSGEAVEAVQRQATDVRVRDVDPSIRARRDALEAKVRNGETVKITAREMEELYGVDWRIIDNRQQSILYNSEGLDASQEMRTVYKLSNDDSALVAHQLRTEHPDIWTGKWNPVSDKGFKPGEELFLSPEDVKRFEANPVHPGETVNYTPRKLTDQEFNGLSDTMKDQYLARQKDAAGWDAHTGFDSRKNVDYSDPAVKERYGEMHSAEDPRNPVKQAEFWKDSNDNRVYVRYQTQDGTWSPPRRQASDVDTVAHQGGSRVDDATSETMQYRESFGQLGEGNTPKWAMNFIKKDGAGNYVIRDPSDRNMMFKAIDQLNKAENDVVLRVDLDGPVLTKQSYDELGYLKQAAQGVDWTPEQAASLRQWGILRAGGGRIGGLATGTQLAGRQGANQIPDD